MQYQLLSVLAGALVLSGCAYPQVRSAQPTQFVQVVHHVSLPVASVGAVSGHKQPLDFMTALDPDCASRGAPIVTVLRPSVHGQVSSAPERDFPSFHADDPRAHCDVQRVAGTRLFYSSVLGYTGPDPFLVSILFPTGHRETIGYAMQVQ